ncbi:MAG: PAC2 family protein [Actinomycetota bacterium]
MLDVDRWPTLVRPLFVVALSGWVDAGGAGAGAASALVDQLSDCDEFARLDLADLLDLQQTRPTARFEDGGLRVIDWPRLTLVAGRAGRDVVVCTGPEPSLRWPAVTTAIVEVAARLGVTDAATLGGMPALTSHRRPPPVLTTATSRSLAQEVGPVRADYVGPTGLQTVVQRALGEAGIGCVGLWVQVPQYVSGSPSPPAVRALLARLAELGRLDVVLAGLDVRAAAYLDRVEAGLAARPDVKEIVDRLDEAVDAGPQGPEPADGGALVAEIERFLRTQDGPGH